MGSYPYSHRQQRTTLTAQVDAGEAHCAEPICLEELAGRTRWIQPGTPWDLAHDRINGGYRGTAHARCNRAEGGREARANDRTRRRTTRTW